MVFRIKDTLSPFQEGEGLGGETSFYAVKWGFPSQKKYPKKYPKNYLLPKKNIQKIFSPLKLLNMRNLPVDGAKGVFF